MSFAGLFLLETWTHAKRAIYPLDAIQFIHRECLYCLVSSQSISFINVYSSWLTKQPWRSCWCHGREKSGFWLSYVMTNSSLWAYLNMNKMRSIRQFCRLYQSGKTSRFANLFPQPQITLLHGMPSRFYLSCSSWKMLKN